MHSRHSEFIIFQKMQDIYIYFQNTFHFLIKVSFLSIYRPIYFQFSSFYENFRNFTLDLDAALTSIRIIFSTFFVIYCFNTLLTTIYQQMGEFVDYHYQKVKISSGSYRQCLLSPFGLTNGVIRRPRYLNDF